MLKVIGCAVALLLAGSALADSRLLPNCGVNPGNPDCVAKTPLDPNLNPQAVGPRTAAPGSGDPTPYAAGPGPYNPSPPQGAVPAPGR